MRNLIKKIIFYLSYAGVLVAGLKAIDAGLELMESEKPQTNAGNNQ